MSDTTPTCRCILCNKTFLVEQIRSLMSCPNCGGSMAPLLPSKDVEIKINWAELRLLSQWAERMVSQIARDGDPESQKVFYAILERIRQQQPELFANSPVSFQQPLRRANEFMDKLIREDT